MKPITPADHALDPPEIPTNTIDAATAEAPEDLRVASGEQLLHLALGGETVQDRIETIRVELEVLYEACSHSADWYISSALDLILDRLRVVAELERRRTTAVER
jgi:hypothetical protein